MYIYKITNKINGKIYIGQTVGTVQNRFNEHCRSSKCSTPIDKAIKKYGKYNFSVEILEETDNIDTLNELEIKYIAEYNSTDMSIGYNLCKGGMGTVGYHHRPDSCAKMTQSRIGIFAGEKNPFYGKHHTEEQRAKWSAERKGRHLTDEWKANVGKSQWKPVINITTGERFESVKAAGEYYGISPNHISYTCRGKQKTCRGYKFMYDNTVPSQTDSLEGVTTIPNGSRAEISTVQSASHTKRINRLF